MPISRAAIAALAIALAHPAAAAEGVGRPALPDVAVQLLDGGREDDARRLAGVEMRIAPGWKTYWRHPGDSGLAPSFDFSDSSNVADVEVLWPAPALSHDGYGWVVGYEREVVFPLVVTPEDPAQPVELVLDMDFAICARICVPLEAAETRRLDDAGPDRTVIGYFRDLVPEKVDGADGHGVLAVSEVASPNGPVLELEVAMPGGGASPQLIVEGPREWLFAVPELIRRGPDGAAVFRVPLEAVLPDGSGADVELRVTGIAPRSAFWQWVQVP